MSRQKSHVTIDACAGAQCSSLIGREVLKIQQNDIKGSQSVSGTASTSRTSYFRKLHLSLFFKQIQPTIKKHAMDT